MRRLWVVCAVLAGCSNSRDGLLLQVSAKDVAHVELFIAMGPTPSSSITPPSLTMPTVTGQQYAGTGWFIEPTIAEMNVDGNGNFELTSAGSGSTIASLLIVAYDGNWTPTAYTILHDVFVPANNKQTIVFEDMTPYSALDTSSKNGLQVWNKASDATKHTHSSCAVVRNAGTLEFFAPTDDPDCDDTDPDCAPFVFHNMSGPDANHLSCITPATDVPSICRVGGVACDDGTPAGSNATCTPSAGAPYCVPTDMCSTSGDTTCDTIGSSCFDNNAKSSATAIHCTFTQNLDSTPCAMPEVLAVPIGLTNLVGTCSAIRISPSQVPLAFTTTATIDGATVSVMPMTASTCAVSVSFTPPDAQLNQSDVIGLVDVVGTGPTHFVVPIEFLGVSGMSGGQCTVTCDAVNAPEFQCH